MREYPYWTVESHIGRLADVVPPQYRHTPIEKQFKDGRIGGRQTTRKEFSDHEEAQRFAIEEERRGKRVDVYRARSPSHCRIICMSWRHPNWNGES